MTKRSRDDIDVDQLIDSINLDKGLRAGVLELTADQLATLLADFANLANLPTAAFKKARVGLPSFSTVKWTGFAREYGLPLNASHLHLAPFTTQGIASRRHYMRPCSKMLGVGKTSIVRRLIREGRKRE